MTIQLGYDLDWMAKIIQNWWQKKWINPIDTRWKVARWNKYVFIQHSMDVIQHS